jgi:hypothetical protein
MVIYLLVHVWHLKTHLQLWEIFPFFYYPWNNQRVLVTYKITKLPHLQSFTVTTLYLNLILSFRFRLSDQNLLPHHPTAIILLQLNHQQQAQLHLGTEPCYSE